MESFALLPFRIKIFNSKIAVSVSGISGLSSDLAGAEAAGEEDSAVL